MKHVLASLTVAVCLLLPSAGVVLAANPHTVTGTTGQPGTNNGITCNSTTTGGVVIGGGPGGSTSGDGSAFKRRPPRPSCRPPMLGTQATRRRQGASVILPTPSPSTTSLASRRRSAGGVSGIRRRALVRLRWPSGLSRPASRRKCGCLPGPTGAGGQLSKCCLETGSAWIDRPIHLASTRELMPQAERSMVETG